MKVLYAKNDGVFAAVVVSEFLADHDVTVVPTIRQAIARAATESFDAVLVDYDLDDGKGTSIVRAVRSHGFRGRIVAVSSHEPGNAALREAGADAVCSKLAFAHIAEHLTAATLDRLK